MNAANHNNQIDLSDLHNSAWRQGSAAPTAIPAPTDAANSFLSLSPASDRKGFRIVSIAELGPSEEPDWVLPGYLARGTITLFTGLWKAGKTTFIGHLLRDLGRGSGLVDSPMTDPVLVLSEEPPGFWAQRRDALGIGENVHFLVPDSFSRLPLAGWVRLIDDMAAEVKEHGIGLVVFDTLSSFWPVSNENDAGEVIEALAPIRNISAAGASVLLIFHPRKSDGAEATATRGSGALPGFVDVIVELRRYAPDDSTDHRRVLTAYGRFEQLPPERVIELGPDGYTIIGDRATAKAADITATILDLLPSTGGGLTADEIREQWPTNPKPGATKLRGLLNQGAFEHQWDRFGMGRKCDPYRYRAIPPEPDSFQSPTALSERNEFGPHQDEGEVK